MIPECPESRTALAWWSRVWSLNLPSAASDASCHVPEEGSRPANQGCGHAGSQRVVPGPASSRTSPDMYILGPNPRSTESETPEAGPSDLCFYMSSRGFWRTLQFENYCSKELPPIVTRGRSNGQGQGGAVSTAREYVPALPPATVRAPGGLILKGEESKELGPGDLFLGCV